MEGQPIALHSRTAFVCTLCVVMFMLAAFAATHAWRHGAHVAIMLASSVAPIVTLWHTSARLAWSGDTISRGYLFGAVCRERFRMGELAGITVWRGAGGQVSRLTLHFPTGKVRLSRLQSGYGAALARLKREFSFELEHARPGWF